MPSNENGGHANGITKSTRAYPPGIHVPSLTFFDGIVIAGTNGEAVALSREEKIRLVTTIRDLACAHGRPELPITVGTNPCCSTRDVIDDCLAAKEARADFVLVLVPAFFHFAMSKDAICDFFEEVAGQSPVPVLIYNFPGVAAGLNVDSGMLDRLARHENIVGVKLTCGSIAKVTRVAASFKPEQFSALAGQSDWLVPALSVGGTGCITGCANLFPKVCIAIYDQYIAGELKEARRLQLELGKMELGFGDGGINGTKWVMSELLGYPSDSRHCRKPYPRFTDRAKQQWILNTVNVLEPEEAKLR